MALFPAGERVSIAERQSRTLMAARAVRQSAHDAGAHDAVALCNRVIRRILADRAPAEADAAFVIEAYEDLHS